MTQARCGDNRMAIARASDSSFRLGVAELRDKLLEIVNPVQQHVTILPLEGGKSCERRFQGDARSPVFPTLTLSAQEILEGRINI